MCNIDQERPDLYRHTTQKARKPYECVGGCGAPILLGTAYAKQVTLYDGDWSTFRLHVECEAFMDHVARDLCGSDMYDTGSVHDQYSEAVEDHGATGSTDRLYESILTMKMEQDNAK
jgi:hypothetical protein